MESGSITLLVSLVLGRAISLAGLIIGIAGYAYSRREGRQREIKGTVGKGRKGRAVLVLAVVLVVGGIWYDLTQMRQHNDDIARVQQVVLDLTREHTLTIDEIRHKMWDDDVVLLAGAMRELAKNKQIYFLEWQLRDSTGLDHTTRGYYAVYHPDSTGPVEN